MKRRLSPSVPALVLALSFVSLLYGCGDDGKTIWGIEKQEFLSRIRYGDREFLRHLDFRKIRLSEIRRGGDGAAWYLAHIFADFGMSDIEDELLTLEWQKGEGIYRKEAGKLLISRYFEAENYTQAEKTAETFIRKYPDEADMVRRLIEARYWQQKDDEVIRHLAEFEALPEAVSDTSGPPENEQEPLLWDAVAKCRLGKAGWDDLFRRLFYDYPASSIHGRAYDFILLSDERKSRFSEAELAVFAGKVKYFAQEYGNAWALLDPLITVEAPVTLSPWVLREAARAYLGAGKTLEGAKKLDALVTSLKGSALFAALEMSGRLYRSAGRYSEAISRLDASLEVAPTPGDYDRALWYMLSSRVKKSPEAASLYIREYASLWHDPAYFADVLEELAHLLLERRRWDLLWEVYSTISTTGPDAAGAQYAVLLAGGVREGSFSRDGESKEELIESLYRHALGSVDSLYYRFIAAAALGEPVKVEDPSFLLPRNDTAGEEEASDEADLVEGFFRYGMFEKGYRAAEQFSARMEPADLAAAARELAEKGFYLESLRLLNRAFRGISIPYNRGSLEAFYPRAYLNTLQPLAEKENLSLSLIYGLIREESYFDPTIVSHSGAVGLSQLMPATAEDVASRIGLQNPVLTDPATNLTIGTRYLAMLLDRFEYPVYALAGYNAGYGRIRSWISRWGGHSFELFVERLPFSETREYIRKVLVSSAFYGYLYEGRDITSTVDKFFPGLALDQSR